MRQRVDAGRFSKRGVISAAGVVASLAFALPARAEGRRHDGFYAAANAGVGYSKTSAEDRIGGSGITTPVSLWLGSTVGAVALGGGLTTEFAYTRSWLGSADFFADIYPDPKGGFHIMPSAGWGFLFPHAAHGLVFKLGVGYDYWVGPEVSMGIMARMTIAPLRDGADSYTTYAPALLYTVTYQ